MQIRQLREYVKEPTPQNLRYGQYALLLAITLAGWSWLYADTGFWSDFIRHAASAFFGSASTLIMYKLFAENTDALKRRLKRAEKLEGKDGRPVRIWVDGCFDMMHFGHANAFRQAKALGDVLIVGVNTDAEILKYKGAPLMNDHERIVAVSACKWVDEVVTGVPYMMNDEYLNFIFDTYNVDYVVHGDDPCLLPDGSDVYGNVKKLGKFKTIKRTEGVSTTEIVGRMLMMNKDHHVRNAAEERGKRIEELDTETGSFVRHTSFMPTGRRFIQFSNNKSPKSDDVIVYVDGTWDLFHAGHIEFLEQARKLGTFLLVGVYPDDLANKLRGSNYPSMNLHERVLSVLACKFVDDVIFGAPLTVTKDLITSFNIKIVACGQQCVKAHNFYDVPEEMGIFKEIGSPSKLTTEVIVDRILQQRMAFESKFKKKAAAEERYNKEKGFVEEM